MAKFTTSDLILDHELVDFGILFCNLEGRAEDFNNQGARNFRLKFNDADFAKSLADDGWNIKIYTPKNDDYDPYYYLTVKAKFRVDGAAVRQDPEIHMINSKNDILLGAQNMADLDAKFRAREVNACDLVIRPYYWSNSNMGSGDGITAYLKQMWAVVNDNPFAERYADRNDDFTHEVPFD